VSALELLERVGDALERIRRGDRELDGTRGEVGQLPQYCTSVSEKAAAQSIRTPSSRAASETTMVSTRSGGTPRSTARRTYPAPNRATDASIPFGAATRRRSARPSPYSTGIIPCDPAARHVLIWGRRPDRHGQVRSHLPRSDLARLQALLSGY